MSVTCCEGLVRVLSGVPEEMEATRARATAGAAPILPRVGTSYRLEEVTSTVVTATAVVIAVVGVTMACSSHDVLAAIMGGVSSALHGGSFSPIRSRRGAGAICLTRGTGDVSADAVSDALMGCGHAL